MSSCHMWNVKVGIISFQRDLIIGHKYDILSMGETLMISGDKRNNLG